MNLFIFLTYNISLKDWHALGILDRESKFFQMLGKRDIRVSLITYGTKEDYTFQDLLPGAKILPFYAFFKKPHGKIMQGIMSLFLPFVFRKQLKSADLFRTNQLWGSWVPILAALLYRKKVIVRCGYEKYKNDCARKYSFFYLSFVRIISWVCYHLAYKIIVTTKEISFFIQKEFHIKRDKIAIIGNFVETELFKPYEGPKNGKIVYVGRLSPEKNLISLLEAIALTPYEIDLIGTGSMAKQLDEFIQCRRIHANLLGQIPNNQLPNVINKYSAFVLCSFFEGNPKAMLEAMSCGLPVIGSNVSGINELITDNENGILCGTTSKEIAEAINKIYHGNCPSAIIGNNARKYIVDKFSIEKSIEEENALYSMLA